MQESETEKEKGLVTVHEGVPSCTIAANLARGKETPGEKREEDINNVKELERQIESERRREKERPT